MSAITDIIDKKEEMILTVGKLKEIIKDLDDTLVRSMSFEKVDLSFNSTSYAFCVDLVSGRRIYIS